MSERRFIESLKESAKKLEPSAFTWKTNDRVSIGIPDLLIVIDGVLYAIEVKCTSFFDKDRLIEDPRNVLTHPFSGPQVGVLRQMARSGACAMGAIQTHKDRAYIVHPLKIPASGNFTFAELYRVGIKVSKHKGIWRLDEWQDLLISG